MARWGTAASLLQQYIGVASGYSAGRAPTGDEDDGSGKAEDFQARHEPVGQSASAVVYSMRAAVMRQTLLPKRAWRGMHGMAWHSQR